MRGWITKSIGNIFILTKRSPLSKAYDQTKRVPDVFPVPRNIWIYWHDGWGEVPDLIRYCARSWENKNPRWVVNRHDYKSICKEFPELGQIDTRRKAHFADLVRFNLLARYGGVWADSTVLCAVGLDSWLPLVQVGSPFFVFSNPGPDRLISNWFIVSTNSSTAIKEWRDAATGHFASRWTYKTYYSVHYLFQWRAKTQKKVKDEFKSMAKVSAVGPLTLEVAAQRGFMNCSEADLIRASPVHKLSSVYSSQGGPWFQMMRDLASN